MLRFDHHSQPAACKSRCGRFLRDLRQDTIESFWNGPKQPLRKHWTVKRGKVASRFKESIGQGSMWKVLQLWVQKYCLTSTLMTVGNVTHDPTIALRLFVFGRCSHGARPDSTNESSDPERRCRIYSPHGVEYSRSILRPAQHQRGLPWKLLNYE